MKNSVKEKKKKFPHQHKQSARSQGGKISSQAITDGKTCPINPEKLFAATQHKPRAGSEGLSDPYKGAKVSFAT